MKKKKKREKKCFREFLYKVTKDGEEKIKNKKHVSKRNKERNVHVQFEEKMKIWQTRIHVGAIFLSKALFFSGGGGG